MNRDVRRKLDGAVGARSFVRSHPSDGPGYAQLAARLDEGLAQADALAETQVKAMAESRSLTAQGRRLRRQAQKGYLALIVRAGQAATRTDPERASLFQPVSSALSVRGFLTEARALLAAAREHADALTPHGAPPEVVAAATELVEQCVATADAAAAARARQVQATAGLGEIADDVADVLVRLDAFNRHRFVEEPELLAGWLSARNVRPRSRRNGTGAPTAGNGAEPGQPATPPDASGEVNAA